MAKTPSYNMKNSALQRSIERHKANFGALRTAQQHLDRVKFGTLYNELATNVSKSKNAIELALDAEKAIIKQLESYVESDREKIRVGSRWHYCGQEYLLVSNYNNATLVNTNSGSYYSSPIQVADIDAITDLEWRRITGRSPVEAWTRINQDHVK